MDNLQREPETRIRRRSGAWRAYNIDRVRISSALSALSQRKVSMRHLQLISHGEPLQVVELKTFTEPDLGEDDVRIAMEAAPIDLTFF
jgi:hypothetical protein